MFSEWKARLRHWRHGRSFEPKHLHGSAYARGYVRMETSTLKRWAKELKQQALVIYFVARDPRTPWLVRLLGFFVAAYALSPIDLIPDFIPLLGYLDDLVLVPLGVLIVLRLVPLEVKQSAREMAAVAVDRPVSRAMAVVIVTIWLVMGAVLGLWVWRWVRA